MGLVLCERTASGDWQLFCEKCRTSLDIIGSEMLADIRQDYAPVLCMDCDEGSDEVPSCLLFDTFPYVLVLGEKPILVDPFGKLRHLSGRIEHFKGEVSRAFRQGSTQKPTKTAAANPSGSEKALSCLLKRLLGGK